MLKTAIKIISENRDLEPLQMRGAMEEILSGKADTDQIVLFLRSLSKKGESVEELKEAVAVMRQHATKIKTRHKALLDTCGTGGDRKGTFNISTAAAFVAAGAGLVIAKHGNRSVSSRSGSADLLEAAGININLSPQRMQRCLDKIGIAFLFAQSLHPAMKYAMPARKKIAEKTIFNLLGPLSNPAGATHQLAGVYARQWVEPVAKVLLELGSEHAMVVYGEDGLDEITTTGRTFISEAYNGEVRSYTITPEEFGLKRAAENDLLGGTAVENARIFLDILKGKAGFRRDIVLLNAGAAIYTAGRAESIGEGMRMAAESIDSGQAQEKLELLRKYSNGKG